MPLIGLCLLVLVILVVPQFPTAQAATSRVLVITNSSAKPITTFANFDGNPPKLFDINGDGKLEIIAQNDNQWVYVFDSKTGALLFQVKTKFPDSGWGARSFNGPEVAVLQEGGSVRLVVANSAAYITVFRFDATGSSSTNFKFVKEWEKRLTECHSSPGMDAKPVLADLDNDGKLEILAATEERGLYALRASGAKYWTNCLGGGNAEPTVGDLNLDGWPDVVHVSDGGVVAALNGQTGGWKWSYNAKTAFGLGSGSMPVGATIAQLDGSGGRDVVVGARDSHDAENFDNNHALLLALSSSGKLLWGRQHPEANPLTYTHPIVADADKDGKPEVYWGDWNTMGHKPPFDEEDAWQRTGDANFYRYDQWGNLVWRQTLGTWWSNKDLAIADVDGDGQQEVLANGPKDGADGIWYLNVKTGAKEAFVSAAPYSISRGPIVGDLWNTGTMQWVVEAGKQILVYDTHEASSSVWPHLPYVSFDRGTITTTPTTRSPPTTTTSPPTTTPTGDSFAATFRITAPNEWWQQVDVDPDDGRSVTNVQVRINSGSWRTMTLQSWGEWTSGHNTPEGSRVEFLATAGNGDPSQSQPFIWMDGTLTQRSINSDSSPTPTTVTDPPTTRPGPTTTATDTFEATFDPHAVGNDGWVQVNVTSADVVVAVDASLNGGSWRPLDLQSYGHWAKGMSVSDGTQVVFRATNDAGAVATSDPVTWT